MQTVKRHPVIAYFVLAYVLTWWMFPLLQLSPLLGLFGLFGPALAAIVMAAMINGRSGVQALLKRVVRWRVGVRWYAIALGGPAVLALVAAGLAVVLGASSSIQIGTAVDLRLRDLRRGCRRRAGLARVRPAQPP